jgi:hypothetical protein
LGTSNDTLCPKCGVWHPTYVSCEPAYVQIQKRFRKEEGAAADRDTPRPQPSPAAKPSGEQEPTLSPAPVISKPKFNEKEYQRLYQSDRTKAKKRGLTVAQFRALRKAPPDASGIS